MWWGLLNECGDQAMLNGPFDSAATAHSEQAERVEGDRRGFAQGEHQFLRWEAKDPTTLAYDKVK